MSTQYFINLMHSPDFLNIEIMKTGNVGLNLGNIPEYIPPDHTPIILEVYSKVV